MQLANTALLFPCIACQLLFESRSRPPGLFMSLHAWQFPLSVFVSLRGFYSGLVGGARMFWREGCCSRVVAVVVQACILE